MDPVQQQPVVVPPQAPPPPQTAVVQPVQADPVMLYASFWRRWLASLIDMIVVGAASFVIALLFGLLGTILGLKGLFGTLSTILSSAISIVYYVYLIGKNGQTIGKIALKIKVKKADSELPLGYGKAFVREILGKFVSGIVLSLGYLWMLWDPKKQAWHDKIAKTVVVKI